MATHVLVHVAGANLLRHAEGATWLSIVTVRDLGTIVTGKGPGDRCHGKPSPRSNEKNKKSTSKIRELFSPLKV